MIEMGPIISKMKKYALDIQASLAPWTKERAEKVDNMDVPVSTRASQADLDTTNTAVGDVKAEVLALANRGEVKSVQRGVVRGKAGVGVDIDISPINPSKSVVVLNGIGLEITAIQSSGINTVYYLKTLSSDVLSLMTVTIGNYKDTDVMVASWQIIEFY